MSVSSNAIIRSGFTLGDFDVVRLSVHTDYNNTKKIRIPQKNSLFIYRVSHTDWSGRSLLDTRLALLDDSACLYFTLDYSMYFTP